MCKWMQMPWGEVFAYNFWINTGSILGTAGLLGGLYARTHSKKETLYLFLGMFAVMCLGAFPAKAVRGMTHGYTAEYGGMMQLLFTYPGSHFIGRVLFCVLVYPYVFRIFFSKKELSCEVVMDRFCIFFTVQHFFNRLACFYNGCCVGSYYNGVFAVQYPGTGSGAGYRYPVYPAVVFEMASMLLLFLWFVFLWKKHKSITEKFEIAFGIVIFLSEFMMDKSGTIQIAGLTVVQYAALLLTVLGIRTAYQRINHTIAVVNID